ncbi:hypothetical protein [Collimonas silvisoli]|uniref:hypothetical protein n=1 Tax=Collimonas silvisoli TaxID=2825884 RepID=UPI001B8BE3EB|nr:hypothetical protein [Collimonas silvisoli]
MVWGNDLFAAIYSDLDSAYNNGENFIKEKANAVADAAVKSVQWIWEALQGDFNNDLTVGQITGNAVLGIVPIVGQILALRDLIANCRKIYNDLHNVTAWIVLCLTLVAFFPALGAPVKGVFRILFYFVRKAGGNTAKALEPAIKPIIGFLCDPKVQRILHISELDVALKSIAGKIREAKNLVSVNALKTQFSEALTTLESIIGKIRLLAPTRVANWLDESLTIVRTVRQEGDLMIAQALAPLQKILDDFAIYLEKEAAEHAPGYAAQTVTKNVHALPEGIAEVDPRILSNAKKGLYGEIISDHYMVGKGHQNLLPENRIKRSLEDMPTGRGLDGVYKNASPPPPYIITETKYRTATGQYIGSDGTASTDLLSTTKGSQGYPAATQMSDDWIEPRLVDAVGKAEAEKIAKAKDSYDRWLILVGPDGKVEQITRLDGAANAIDTIKP